MGHFNSKKWGNRSQVQGFKVLFSSLDCIFDAYLRETRQLRQANPKLAAKLAIVWEKEQFF